LPHELAPVIFDLSSIVKKVQNEKPLREEIPLANGFFLPPRKGGSGKCKSKKTKPTQVFARRFLKKMGYAMKRRDLKFFFLLKTKLNQICKYFLY
jgi:hypothetical protein